MVIILPYWWQTYFEYDLLLSSDASLFLLIQNHPHVEIEHLVECFLYVSEILYHHICCLHILWQVAPFLTTTQCPWGIHNSCTIVCNLHNLLVIASFGDLRNTSLSIDIQCKKLTLYTYYRFFSCNKTPVQTLTSKFLFHMWVNLSSTHLY